MVKDWNYQAINANNNKKLFPERVLGCLVVLRKCSNYISWNKVRTSGLSSLRPSPSRNELSLQPPWRGRQAHSETGRLRPTGAVRPRSWTWKCQLRRGWCPGGHAAFWARSAASTDPAGSSWMAQGPSRAQGCSIPTSTAIWGCVKGAGM